MGLDSCSEATPIKQERFRSDSTSDKGSCHSHIAEWTGWPLRHCLPVPLRHFSRTSDRSGA